MSFGIKQALGAVALSLAATTASAVPVTIDFTTSAWSGANGVTPFSLGGITLETVGARQTLTQGSEGIGINTNCPSGLGGIGCNLNDDPGEVDNIERLRVTLGGEVFLSSIYLMQFNLLETIEISLNGGAWTSYGGRLDGDRTISIMTDGVSFFDIRGRDGISDASLAAVSYVPVPGALALLGIGLLGAGIASRRRVAA